uniref:Uncharacterized protein n=1 Tax=Rhizophora mucronata TaxID=61149 RepID=A0A2P2PIA6_RHIMU
MPKLSMSLFYGFYDSFLHFTSEERLPLGMPEVIFCDLVNLWACQ